MSSVLRIIDANANRAREALRVMEEAARFILDDAGLSGEIKAIRHDLAHALAHCPALKHLEAWRDTPGDVGTAVKTEDEGRRDSIADVAVAAGKRLSEALRAIEEYAKTLGQEAGGLPGAIESLRYRGYTAEQRLTLALGAGRARQWRLCVLISAELCPRGDFLAVAEAALAGGADCLQLREKSLDAGELLSRARLLLDLCRQRRASLIVNDRPDVALLAGADGVHLGQTDLPCAEARKLVGRRLLIGVSTSRIEEAREALAGGADYCGVGPMFPTTTKQKERIAGPEYLREFIAWGKLPHLAIGGINAGNLPELAAVGVDGIAVSSAVCAAADPGQATARLREMLPG